MRLRAAAALAAGSLLVVSGARSETKAPDQPMHFDCELASMPDWVQRPRGPDIARVYPHGGTAGNGDAVMVCNVGEDGRMQGCGIASEVPAGRGFGEATLKLAPLFRITPPICKDGTRARGGRVTIPVRWRIG